MQDDFEVGEIENTQEETPSLEEPKSFLQRSLEAKLRKRQERENPKPKPVIGITDAIEEESEKIVEYIKENLLPDEDTVVTDVVILEGIHEESAEETVYGEESDHDDSEPETPKAKMGRPRKYPEGTPRPDTRSRAKIRVDTESVLAEIKKIKEANPTKKEREIHQIFLESKRDWIIASLFDTAANAESETVRYNARARLKDELDGRVATQDKKDPDEDSAIGKILIPDEM